jgi:hypothetical protein
LALDPIGSRLVIEDDFKSDALVSFQRVGVHEIARMNGKIEWSRCAPVAT